MSTNLPTNRFRARISAELSSRSIFSGALRLWDPVASPCPTRASLACTQSFRSAITLCFEYASTPHRRGQTNHDQKPLPWTESSSLSLSSSSNLEHSSVSTISSIPYRTCQPLHPGPVSFSQSHPRQPVNFFASTSASSPSSSPPSDRTSMEFGRWFLTD